MALVTVVLSAVMAVEGGWPMGLVAALHLGGVTLLIALFAAATPAAAAAPPQPEHHAADADAQDGEAD